MPHNNDDWLKQERLLALDFYYSFCYKKIFNQKHDLVKLLSNNLQKLYISITKSNSPLPPDFRSVDSVIYKMRVFEEFEFGFENEHSKYTVDHSNEDYKIWSKYQYNFTKLYLDSQKIKDKYNVSIDIYETKSLINQNLKNKNIYSVQWHINQDINNIEKIIKVISIDEPLIKKKLIGIKDELLKELMRFNLGERKTINIVCNRFNLLCKKCYKDKKEKVLLQKKKKPPYGELDFSQNDGYDYRIVEYKQKYLRSKKEVEKIINKFNLENEINEIDSYIETKRKPNKQRKQKLFQLQLHFTDSSGTVQ